jgi:hypothetical protein
MTPHRRIGAGLAALTALAAVLTGATPAQADAQADVCDQQDTICIYPRPDAGGIPLLLDATTFRSRYPGGRNLSAYNFDNVANGALNSSDYYLLLCRYPNGGGHCWSVPPHHLSDWTGVAKEWDTASWIRVTT